VQTEAFPIPDFLHSLVLPSIAVAVAAAERCAGDKKTARRVADPLHLHELGSKHAEVRAPAQTKFL